MLLDPRSRAIWDATHGNFLGVARELNDGFDLEVLGALREQFVRERPALRSPPPLPPLPLPPTGPRADAFAAELARRLKEDPLNIDLHRRYWPLRQALRKHDASAHQTLPA